MASWLERLRRAGKRFTEPAEAPAKVTEFMAAEGLVPLQENEETTGPLGPAATVNPTVDNGGDTTPQPDRLVADPAQTPADEGAGKDEPSASGDETIPDGRAVEGGGEALAQTAPLAPPDEEEAGLATLISRRAVPRPRLTMNYAYRCHIGAVRGRNEDYCFVLAPETGGQVPMRPFGLFIIADGMGGHHNGHEASRRVSQILTQQVLEKIYLPLLQTAAPDTQQPVQDVLLHAVQNANDLIFNPDPDEDMGTTITAALILDRRMYLTHVGDSRAYLLKADGSWQQLTTDHTLVQRLQDAGHLTAEEAERHPHRNVLYRAVGQGGDLEIDMVTRPVPDNGKLLLCSDGLWGLIPPATLQDVIQQDVSLEEMADSLVNLALRAGGHDNITLAIIEFVSG